MIAKSAYIGRVIALTSIMPREYRSRVLVLPNQKITVAIAKPTISLNNSNQRAILGGILDIRVSMRICPPVDHFSWGGMAAARERAHSHRHPDIQDSPENCPLVGVIQ